MNASRGRSRLFWPLVGVGWAVILFGAAGMLRNAGRTKPPELARWLVGSAIVHDGLIAPLVFAAGVLVARAVPPGIRRFVQAGLVITGMLVLATFPFVGGWGRQPDNPSALPGNYGLGLGAVLSVVWGIVLLLAGRSLARSRARPPDEEPAAE